MVGLLVIWHPSSLQYGGGFPSTTCHYSTMQTMHVLLLFTDKTQEVDKQKEVHKGREEESKYINGGGHYK